LVIILTDGLLVGTRDLVEEANNLKNFASVLTVGAYVAFIYHISVLFSFVTYHRICRKSITTGATSGAGTAYPSEEPKFSHDFIGTTQWPKKVNYKRTDKDVQNITQKTKDRVTRTPLKSGLSLGSSEE
jgi:hypothetical protein